MEDQGEQALKLGLGVGSVVALTVATTLPNLIKSLPETAADALNSPAYIAAAGALIGGFIGAARLPATPKVYTPVNAAKIAATCLTSAAIAFDAAAAVQLVRLAVSNATEQRVSHTPAPTLPNGMQLQFPS